MSWKPSNEEVETVRGMCADAMGKGDREEFWLTVVAICEELQERRSADDRLQKGTAL